MTFPAVDPLALAGVALGLAGVVAALGALAMRPLLAATAAAAVALMCLAGLALALGGPDVALVLVLGGSGVGLVAILATLGLTGAMVRARPVWLHLPTGLAVGAMTVAVFWAWPDLPAGTPVGADRAPGPAVPVLAVAGTLLACLLGVMGLLGYGARAGLLRHPPPGAAELPPAAIGAVARASTRFITPLLGVYAVGVLIGPHGGGAAAGLSLALLAAVHLITFGFPAARAAIPPELAVLGGAAVVLAMALAVLVAPMAGLGGSVALAMALDIGLALCAFACAVLTVLSLAARAPRLPDEGV
jgi:hypothetical protein